MPLRRFLIHTQPIPTSTFLIPIPSTRHPTLPLIHLCRRIPQRVSTVAFRTILSPEIRIRCTHPCTLLDRHIWPRLPGIIQDTLVDAVRVATLVCEFGDLGIYRRTDGCAAVEVEIEAGQAAAVLFVVACAEHVAIICVLWDTPVLKGVAAVAFSFEWLAMCSDA